MPPVGRVNITAADAVGTAPITTIELPDNGGKPLCRGLAERCRDGVGERCVSGHGHFQTSGKTGDTMTGKLTI